MRTPSSPSRREIFVTVCVVALLVTCWLLRPWLHAPAMLLYRYPLVTWMPLVVGVIVFLVIVLIVGRSRRSSTSVELAAGCIVASLMWVFCMIGLPGWQGSAVYEASDYLENSGLPSRTQPRLLPKRAAERFGEDNDMRVAHLAVDPSSGQLVWTAEHKPGLFPARQC